ncbi:hypothetical protein [Gordonia aichiensis]
MTAKTWNEVFTRLDAFVDGFSADVRAVADMDGTGEAEVRSLRAALEAAEVEVGRLKRERDVLPTPDAANPVHCRFAVALCDELRASGEMDGYQGSLSVVARELECRAAKIEYAHTAKASVDALVEKAARAIHDSDEQGKFPPGEWEVRSEALRNDYRANARALYAAGLLADSERSTES